MGMKGQHEAITVILLSGILIGVVGSVYFWGIPLIQKNKDVATLENSEKFIRNLNNKIKFVATNGGRDQVQVTIPGIVRFVPDSNILELVIDTEGTIYATGAEIPIGKNSQCASDTGDFGVDNPETICVKSDKAGKSSFRTAYRLKYIKLVNEEQRKSFVINLTGAGRSGGESSTIIFENKGNTQVVDGGRILISTLIGISIV